MATVTGEVRFTCGPTAILPEWSGDVLVSLDPGEHPPMVVKDWDNHTTRGVDQMRVLIDWSHDAPRAAEVTLHWGDNLSLTVPPTLVRFRVARPGARMNRLLQRFYAWLLPIGPIRLGWEPRDRLAASTAELLEHGSFTVTDASGRLVVYAYLPIPPRRGQP